MVLQHFYLVKVLHLVSVGEPGLFVVARLDDKHLVVGKHLREAVGKDLAHLDVELVHFQLLFVALVARVPEAAAVLPHLQLLGRGGAQKGEVRRARGRVTWGGGASGRVWFHQSRGRGFRIVTRTK